MCISEYRVRCTQTTSGSLRLEGEAEKDGSGLVMYVCISECRVRSRQNMLDEPRQVLFAGGRSEEGWLGFVYMHVCISECRVRCRQTASGSVRLKEQGEKDG